jgi:hypothetical protein
MDDSFDASLEFTLAEEGGWIDHPTDVRFATNQASPLPAFAVSSAIPG